MPLILEAVNVGLKDIVGESWSDDGDDGEENRLLLRNNSMEVGLPVSRVWCVRAAKTTDVLRRSRAKNDAFDAFRLQRVILPDSPEEIFRRESRECWVQPNAAEVHFFFFFSFLFGSGTSALSLILCSVTVADWLADRDRSVLRLHTDSALAQHTHRRNKPRSREPFTEFLPSQPPSSQQLVAHHLSDGRLSSHFQVL